MSADVVQVPVPGGYVWLALEWVPGVTVSDTTGHWAWVIVAQTRGGA